VLFCPPSLGSARGRIVAVAWCSRELSTCFTAATERMIFTHWHTLPPSLAGVASSTFRRVTTTATFWLAVVKAGSCCSPDSFSMAQLASNADSRWSTSANLASAAALSLTSLP
jgi:hypothetical protein